MSVYVYETEPDVYDSLVLVHSADYGRMKWCLQGRHMFKLRQTPLSKVYVSEELKRRVEEAGLEGLSFPAPK